MPQMTLKQMTQSRRPKFGTMVVEFDTPGMAKILKATGLDFAFIDMERKEGGLAVGLAKLFRHRAGLEAVVGDLQGDAAVAGRRVLHAIEDIPRLLGRADHRHHNALGADVQRAGDVVVLARWNAH